MHATLLHWIRDRACACPSSRIYTFLNADFVESGSFDYAELDFAARRLGALLQSGQAQGERGLLLLPPGLDFIRAFIGCLYAGVVAVPAYPPQGAKAEQWQRIKRLIEDADCRFILCMDSERNAIEAWCKQSGFDAVRCLAMDTQEGDADSWIMPTLTADDIAFLQYTSGSTGAPKGVMISHGNLLHNQQLIQQHFGHTEQSIGVGWLPPYHDMGLIGHILQPLYVGMHSVLMAPLTFLRRPQGWLETIGRYRATTSGGPNFAFDLCVERINAADIEGLDLSSWEIAYNGAEPVRAATLQRFAEKFAVCGFRREAFYPCYGLAEATLLVSGGRKGSGVVQQVVQAEALSANRFQAVTDHLLSDNTQTLVSCGRIASDAGIIIVNPKTHQRCAADAIGELWLKTPSVAKAYWRQVQTSAEKFGAHTIDGAGPYLRTGDMGCIHQNQLYITGRLKELIILRGRNYYPQDIEQVAQHAHNALQPGASAAFSVDIDGTERLVVVQELKRSHLRTARFEEVLQAIVRAIVLQHEIQPYAVVLIKPAGLAKTTSGKLRRNRCRELFLQNELNELARFYPGQGLSAALNSDLSTRLAVSTVEGLTDRIRACLAEVLKSPPQTLSLHTPLNSLGLDSLRAAELQYRLETGFNVHLPLEMLFSNITLADLATELNRQATVAAPVNGSVAVDTGFDFPMQTRPSLNQQSLLYLSQTEKQTPVYNIPVAAQILTPLNVDNLKTALFMLLARHPGLRAVYKGQGEQAVQTIQPVEYFSRQTVFTEIDAAQWTQEQLHTAVHREAYRVFDLEAGPLIRVCVYKQAPDRNLLLLIVDHIAADLWSLLVLVEELSLVYQALCAGSTAELPPPRFTPAHFSDWQQRWLRSAAGEAAKIYWHRQLSGELPALDLPTDRPRPALRSYAGGKIGFSFPPALTRSLKELAQQSGSTLYVVLLSVYQVLLHRYSGQTDIPVGSPASGRTLPEFERIVGYLVNPVVMRGDLSANPTFSDYLLRNRTTVIEALKHQHYPLQNLIQELHLKRSPNIAPLFQTLFSLQTPQRLQQAASFIAGNSTAEVRLGGLNIRSYPLGAVSSEVDLIMTAVETDAGLSGDITYNTDLFDPGTIERLIRHYEILLQGIIRNPEQRIAELPLLTSVEQRNMLVDWNSSIRDFPLERCIHDYIIDQVRRTPDAVAVIAADRVLTYAELYSRALTLAHQLRQQGAQPDQLVAILMPRGWEQAVAMFGILISGAAYLPIGADLPFERQLQLLTLGEVRLLVTQAALVDTDRMSQLSTALSIAVLSVDPEEPPANPADLPTKQKPGNLAYVIFTSGSTGVPKGVAIEHRAALNTLFDMNERFGINAQDSVLALSELNFDLSVYDFLGPWLVGGRVVIPDEQQARDPACWAELIRRQRITLWNSVPALMQLYMDHIEQQPRPSLDALRRVWMSGDWIPPSLPDRIRALKSDIEIISLGGATEASIWSICYPVQTRTRGWKSIPYGRALSNQRFYVLNSALQPCPLNVAGDLYIGGIGLARGYWQDRSRTDAGFIMHPKTGERLYKTGDRGRWRPDRQIEFLGRSDTQVKIRGFRIECGEIEHLLSVQPGIQEAAVIAHERRSSNEAGNTDKYLVAYVVPVESPGQINILHERLRRALKTKLPDYMLPAFFVTLDRMPLTPNGKVDRKALVAPDTFRMPAQEYVAPATAMEEKLANIWSEVLHIPVGKIGIYDNFFELGGHSLLAARLVSVINERCAAALSVRILFEAPTPHELALKIGGNNRVIENPPPVPVAQRTFIPLSHGQQRLWLLNKFEGGNTSYNIPAALRISGELNLDALRQAFGTVIKRHESLRTNFITTDSGDPAQIIRSELKPDIPVIQTDATGLKRHIKEHAGHVFDISSEPLIRIGVLKINDLDHVLLLNIHHIIADAWSLGVLIREFSALYNAYLHHQTNPLPPLSIQYPDFSVWQRRLVLDKQLDYWQQQLKAAPVLLDLPADRPRPAVQSYRGASTRFKIDRPLSQAMLHLSRQRNVTLFMTLLAAFKALLYRYTQQTDILVGSPIANRTRPELEPLIGFFVNMLALRTRVNANDSFGALLQQIKNTALDAYENQDVPFEHLVDRINPVRSMGHHPLFQVMFMLQTAPENILHLSGLEVTPIAGEVTTAKFDLTLSITETAAGLEGEIEYNTDLFDQATIERLSRHYTVLLAGIRNNPELRISELPLLTSAEYRQMIYDWNNTRVDYPPDRFVHTLFESQVLKKPDAIAIRYDAQQISYRQLNRRANQLAHYLLQRGVKPDMRVGICLQRSPELIIAMLGVLKAGGCYVPMDPEYPPQRLEYMYSDAGLETVITSSELKTGMAFRAEHAVCLDEAETVAMLARQADKNPHNGTARLDESHLAYVIYTSGSTGQPKGVQITHRGLSNFLQSMAKSPGMQASDRLLAVTTCSFDIAGLELYLPLLVGAQLHIAATDVLKNAKLLQQTLDRQGITMLQATPATWQMLAESNWHGKQDLTMLCGGESWSPALAQALTGKVKAQWNMYGPTETTIWSAAAKVPAGAQKILIQGLVENTRFYVLDADLNPVPIGIAGELYIGGAGLARGYLNRPDLTAEKFITDPFSTVPAERLYRTGDRVRYRADGSIEFLGRTDHQVKLRGFRIECGEIESILIDQPGVREAVVIAQQRQQKDGGGIGNPDKYLVAFLTLEPSAVTAAESDGLIQARLRAGLKVKLPEFMLPSFFVILDRMPLTPNGKIDRHALLLLSPYNSLLQRRGYAAPGSDIERQIVRVWSEVLDIPADKIGIHDNFFDLGGHSLLAAKASARLGMQFGQELPLEVIFRYPVLAEYANYMNMSSKIKSLIYRGEATAAREYEVIDFD